MCAVIGVLVNVVMFSIWACVYGQTGDSDYLLCMGINGFFAFLCAVMFR